MWDGEVRTLPPPATSFTGHMSNLAKPLPPLELLQELFEICSDSPSGLRWKKPRATTLKYGDVAGNCIKNGYWQIGITTDKPRKYYAHRIVYCLQTGKDPIGLEVDHINGTGDPLALRIATPSENAYNIRKKQNTTSSRFKGVSWSKSCNAWIARIRKDNHLTYLGKFKNEIDAAFAYNKAAIEFFGEFASLNDVQD